MSSATRVPRVRWRSMLFVPANVEKLVQSAVTRGADAVILDLEDAVADSAKAEARAAVRPAAALLAEAGVDVFVRINRPWGLAVKDLEAAIGPHVRGLLLPKVQSPEHVVAVAETIREFERDAVDVTLGGTSLIPRIEDARGLQRVDAIATAHPRIVAIGLGAGDFLTDLGASGQDAVRLATFRIIVAARAAGVQPLGLTTHIADFKDLEAFRTAAREARALGASGSACIHPSQIPILNEEFAPTHDEIARARTVVEAYEEATSRGVGALMVGNEFVDAPVYRAALEILSSVDGVGAS